MIWDFVVRRPLSVRDYVVSIKGGPKLWNLMSKVWRRNMCVTEYESYYMTDEKLDVKISFFVIILPNMNSPNFWWQLGTIPDRNHMVPDNWISPTLRLTGSLLIKIILWAERERHKYLKLEFRKNFYQQIFDRKFINWVLLMIMNPFRWSLVGYF